MKNAKSSASNLHGKWDYKIFWLFSIIINRIAPFIHMLSLYMKHENWGCVYVIGYKVTVLYILIVHLWTLLLTYAIIAPDLHVIQSYKLHFDSQSSQALSTQGLIFFHKSTKARGESATGMLMLFGFVFLSRMEHRCVLPQPVTTTTYIYYFQPIIMHPATTLTKWKKKQMHPVFKWYYLINPLLKDLNVFIYLSRDSET